MEVLNEKREKKLEKTEWKGEAHKKGLEVSYKDYYGRNPKKG